MGDITRIKKFGNAGYVISIIAIVFLIIAIVGITLAAGIIAALPSDFITVKSKTDGEVYINLESLLGKGWDESFNEKDLNDMGDNEITFSKTDVGLKGTINSTNENFKLADAIAALIPALVSCVILLIVAFYSKNIFKILKESNTPFVSPIPRYLKTIGWYEITLAVLPWITSQIFSASYQIAGLDSYFKNTTAKGIGFGYIFFALVVFALAHIFEYGRGLQEKADMAHTEYAGSSVPVIPSNPQGPEIM